MHRIQVNDQPEQQIVVPGGLGLGLQDPLVYLKLDEGQGTSVRNEITGKNLNLIGTPGWADGKNGKALQVSASGMGVDVGHLDLYRKAFTLSAWVNIAELGKNQDTALFGGRAPMGADQDNTGTVLQVGVKNQMLFMGFLGRDISGKKTVPLGKWVNLTYTYNPVAETGSLYLDGSLDQAAPQKTYTGPLETIGDAPMLAQGAYALDEPVVIQSCLTAPMVHQLAAKGLESLREGDYTSAWRTLGGAPQSLASTAEIPEGTAITVTVETGDKDGKVLSSGKVMLKDGAQSYPLSGLTAGDQVRLRVQLSNQGWGPSPVLRAVAITADSGREKWSTPVEWEQGQLSPSMVGDFGQ
jgi:hypothetical protein